MKSKSSDIETFFTIILALVAISDIWSDIRENISGILEGVIDHLNPETADRMLSVAEILDQLLLIFKGKTKSVD